MTNPVVVVGGGISGLAAAHQLHTDGRHFVLLEASSRLGGKVDAGPVEGADLAFPVDKAADGFLARQPEVIDLCTELGLADSLVSPSGARAFIWSNEALHPIPTPSVLGVPFEVDAVQTSGLISEAGAREFASLIDQVAEPLVGDASVGSVLRPRVGDEIFERLIDPLLGGINAGNADELSIEAGAAQLAAAARAGGSLGNALRTQVTASQAAAGGPVFNGLRGGNLRLIDALESEFGEQIRTDHPATAIEREGAHWLVRTPSGNVRADSVILASPAPVTAQLLHGHAPFAAETLATLAYGDAVLVTFVIDKDQIDNPLDGSGFLVPRSEGLLMTACSWTSSKWDHYNDHTHAILRVSAGRRDDQRWLDLDPDQIVRQLQTELTATIGLRGTPATRVTPWRQSLPQYRPGHLDRCQAIDASLANQAPGLVVTGAQMRGLGLPACVRQGRDAAANLSTS